jgi:hypothetical protein
VAPIQLDENSERGLSGADWERKYRSAPLALTTEEREHVEQTYSIGGILLCARRHGPDPHRRQDVDRAAIGGVLVGPNELRQVFNDTDAEVFWLIIDAPEELEFPQGSKSKMDLSLIYPTDPKQLPKRLAGVEWPPKT